MLSNSAEGLSRAFHARSCYCFSVPRHYSEGAPGVTPVKLLLPLLASHLCRSGTSVTWQPVPARAPKQTVEQAAPHTVEQAAPQC